MPLPLLVLPWLLALGVWMAGPWLSRRIGHRERLRWVPPGLVIVGGALLWLSAAPADGHDDGGTYGSAHAALCGARDALPDEPELAVRLFEDRAHETLHLLAADPMLDRGVAADLLRAKETVESGIARGAAGAALVVPMDALIARSSAALDDLDVDVPSCAG